MISTITPIYNKAKYLQPSIESLLGQLGSYSSEFIFIDDKSTDNSLEILSKFSTTDRVTIIKMPKHLGRGYARDLGIRKAKRDLIILHDADEIIPPTYLYQMKLGLKHYRMVHPRVIYQYGLDHKIRTYKNGYNPTIPARGFHKSDYINVGGYDLSMGHYELGSFRSRMNAIDQHIEIIDTYVIDLGMTNLKELFNRSYTLHKHLRLLNTFYGKSHIKYHIQEMLLPLGLITSSPIKFVRTLGAIKGYIRRA